LNFFTKSILYIDDIIHNPEVITTNFRNENKRGETVQNGFASFVADGFFNVITTFDLMPNEDH